MSLAIGIDAGSEKTRVRVVILSPDLEYPSVLDHRCFRSLKRFQQYWNDNYYIEHCRTDHRVGASPGQDPLGILFWLRDQGVAVEQS